MEENKTPQPNQTSTPAAVQIEEPRDKVPAYEKAAWAAGGASDAIMTTSIGMFALPVYNIGLGLNPVLVGLAVGIPRLFDAFLDPLMGNISDNTRSKWGRRKPYIFFGGILVSILYWLTWCPPRNWEPWAVFTYYVLMSSMFFVAYTMYLIPHAALGFELSADYNERTRVMAYRSMFGSLFGLFMPFFLTWSKLKIWSPEGDLVIGIRYVTAIAGLVMMVSIVSGAIFCKERVGTQKQEKIKLLPALKYSLTNGPFVIVLGIIMLVIVACFLSNPFEIYIFRYYVAMGNEASGYWMYGLVGFLYGILGLMYTPIISFVATHIGKRNMMLVGITLATLAFLSTLVFYRPVEGAWMANIPIINKSFEIPKAIAWIMLVKIILNPGLTSVWILGFSMIADVCDVDELNSGLRREGMFGALYNTIVIKIGIALITMISGVCIALSGFKADVEPSTQVVNNMRYMYAFVPAGLLVIAFILTYIYPLSEHKMKEVREQLHEIKLKKAAALKQA